jgi:hypothetical protein
MRNLKLQMQVFLPALFVLTISVFQVAAQTATTNEGRRIEIRLKPGKEVFMLSEPTFLSFEIENYSTEDLCVWEGGDYRNRLGRPNSFRVMVTGDKGLAVPQPEAFGSDGLGVDCARIPANGSHTLKLFLPHWATFKTTGTYRVGVRKFLSIQIYSIWEGKHSMESSSHIEADVIANIRVVPDDENKLGEIIDSLGNAMLDANNPEARNSAMALAYINDKRVISYFAQALELFGKSRMLDLGVEYRISLEAIEALSKFKDDSALAALEAAMNSPSEDVRESIAFAFGRMSHPRALELLLKMVDDEDESVRDAAQEGLNKRRRNN